MAEWTRETPTEPGWYWYWQLYDLNDPAKGGAMRLHQVKRNPYSGVLYYDCYSFPDVAALGGYWLGSVQVPPPPPTDGAAQCQP